MSKGFLSKVDLLNDFKQFKEEGQQEQLDFIKEQSEISAACVVKEAPLYTPGARHVGPPSVGINLKVENTFGGTTINGKEFNNMDKMNEYER